MSAEQNPRDPNDLRDLDPEEFVGEPPAGDTSPGEFMSSDQSHPATADDADPDTRPDTRDPNHSRHAQPDDQEDS
jgi:hypothetical protein